MTPIYTGRGDDGMTSLGDGVRVSKADKRVEAYGALDEACSAVGHARAEAEDEMLRDILRFMQQRLMNCGGRLAVPAAHRSPDAVDVTADDVAFLERAIDLMDERAGELQGFILPGGCPFAACLHVARAVLRRAERRVAALDPIADEDVEVVRFLNRSSDALFAMARYANVDCSRTDTPWDPEARAPDLGAYHTD